jgi:predicted dehydrogenase
MEKNLHVLCEKPLLTSINIVSLHFCLSVEFISAGANAVCETHSAIRY